MKLPRNFFKPLAAGAPAPMRELPVRLERMIHFVPPHIEKVHAKVPQLAREVDVVLGNLEDAIPADAKKAARDGFIAMAKATDFGATGLWTRINALNSPWVLDDITELVAAIGNKLDVIMLPKVDGAWDIHYLDQLLAQLEARHDVTKPILIHAILETAEGVMNVEAIAAASPRMQGISLGPADLAASRAMKTTRVGGGHPEYKVLADAASAAARAPRSSRTSGITPSARWSTPARRPASSRSTGRSAISPIQEACEVAVPQRLPDGLRRRVVAASDPGRDRQARVLAGPGRGRLREENSRRHAGRHRRRHDRRQDAGRRDLETGQGGGRSGQTGRDQGSGSGGALRSVGPLPCRSDLESVRS